jgi:protein TonB
MVRYLGKMTDTMTTKWTNPPPDGKRFALAMGVGLVLELTAVLALVTVVAKQPPPSDTPTVVKLSILAPAPPKPPAPKPKPVPPPPKPVPPPPPLPVTPPLPPPPPVPRPAQHVFRHYIKPRIQTPPPAIQPPVMPTPPMPAPPPAPAAPSAGELDMFRAAMRNAVQSVANSVYPDAAKMANESGTAPVTFTYSDGVVTNIQLAQSSGFPLLDQAALEAARIAHYPLPPPGLPKDYTVTIEVQFVLAAPDVSGD